MFIISSKFHPLHHQNIVYNVLKHNASVAKLCGEDIEVRRKGLKTYQIVCDDIKGVRNFEFPNLNTVATSIFEMLIDPLPCY